MFTNKYSYPSKKVPVLPAIHWPNPTDERFFTCRWILYVGICHIPVGPWVPINISKAERGTMRFSHATDGTSRYVLPMIAAIFQVDKRWGPDNGCRKAWDWWDPCGSRTSSWSSPVSALVCISSGVQSLPIAMQITYPLPSQHRPTLTSIMALFKAAVILLQDLVCKPPPRVKLNEVHNSTHCYPPVITSDLGLWTRWSLSMPQLQCWRRRLWSSNRIFACRKLVSQDRPNPDKPNGHALL